MLTLIYFSVFANLKCFYFSFLDLNLIFYFSDGHWERIHWLDTLMLPLKEKPRKCIRENSLLIRGNNAFKFTPSWLIGSLASDLNLLFFTWGIPSNGSFCNQISYAKLIFVSCRTLCMSFYYFIIQHTFSENVTGISKI